MFAIFSVVRRHPCRPAPIPIQAGRTMPTQSRATFIIIVLCPTADVNKSPSQFRTVKFTPQYSPIRAASEHSSPASRTGAIKLNKKFIRRRPTHKAMRTKKASSVIPRHHSAIWVNQIAQVGGALF